MHAALTCCSKIFTLTINTFHQQRLDHSAPAGGDVLQVKTASARSQQAIRKGRVLGCDHFKDEIGGSSIRCKYFEK